MGPDTSKWRNVEAYDFYDAIPVEGIAWECLRRDLAYQARFSDLVKENAVRAPLREDVQRRWGLRFPGRPQLSILDQPVIWSYHVNPGTVLVGEMPGILPPLPRPVSLDLPVEAEAEEGRYGVVGKDGPVPFLQLRGGSADGSLAILLPLDDDLPGRIEAIQRFWQMLKARPVLRDTRLTPYQRQRFRLMMQAADGRSAGASYREIGIALYGERRVLDDPWKTSPLRAAVITLVRNASALIGGGYLGLLRHRRKL